FRALRCESCHDLIVGTPKPGPILGLTGIQHPRDWMLQHFDENRPGQDGSPSTSLTMPQRNALVVFVANLKPDLLVTLLATSPQFINGAQIFVASACASCHKVNGIGGDSGPSLNGVFSRRSETWIREHFAAPRKLSPGSIMPPYKFNPKDEDDLIKYLLSLPE
ncbi:MAG TPA: cytochrome c, partial [Bryobacteraceae bacterium]|nr:cytochrome c [Bryobacteraceae bacterium]